MDVADRRDEIRSPLAEDSDTCYHLPESLTMHLDQCVEQALADLERSIGRGRRITLPNLRRLFDRKWSGQCRSSPNVCDAVFIAAREEGLLRISEEHAHSRVSQAILGLHITTRINGGSDE